MKIVAILPAYNAKNTFKYVVDSLPKRVFDAIILSDDGSRDGTYDAAKKDKRLVVVRTPRNLGYGGNLKFCISTALSRGADVIMELHPDGEYEADGIIPALAKVKKGAHLVLGNRFLGSNNGMYAWKNVGTRVLSAIDRVLLGTRIGDLHQGFRVYTRHLVEQIPYKAYSNNYLFSFEIIVDAIRGGFAVEEVPVSTSYTGKKRGALPKAAILYALQTFLVLLKKTRKEPIGEETHVLCDICHTDLATYKTYGFTGGNGLYRCYACECGVTSPRQINLAPLYSHTYYNLGIISKLKQWVYGVFQLRRSEWLAHAVNVGATVIDVGAGDGSFGRSLGNSYTTISLEAPFAAVESPEVIRADVLSFSVKKPVDAVVFWESLEHMDESDTSIRKAASWLKNGGYVFIEYPRFDSWESRVFGRYWYHLDIPRHRTHFSDSGVCALLESQGFEVRQQHPVWAPEYAVVGCAASLLHWSANDLAKNIQNPLKLGVFVIALIISGGIEAILALCNQSPIGVIVGSKTD